MTVPRRGLVACAALGLLASAGPAGAHDAPFSYLDLRLASGTLSGTLVVHVIDVAESLDLEEPRSLVEPAVAAHHGETIAATIDSRLRVIVNGRRLPASWTSPTPVPDQDGLRLGLALGTVEDVAVLRVEACLFPYDPSHQTFVNIYEEEVLAAQGIATCARPEMEHYAGTRQGTLAVVQRFLPAGVHHILLGPDHLLFLVGLLLVGSSIGQLVAIVTTFTLAHSVTLSLAALGVFTPPAHLVEPAIALSIVYVGADNLFGRGERDVRAWIALGFGLIHGFGFAYVLQDMALPSRALGWSLFAFNLGVEIGQLGVIVPVALAVGALRTRSETAGWWLARGGSVAVLGMGAFWFVERVLS